MQMIGSTNYSNENNPHSKNKKILNIVLTCIVIVMVISAILIGLIYYLVSVQQKALKIYIDEKKVSFNDDTFIIDSNGKVYVAIKDVATSLGYESHNGEYKVYSEEQDKCYVENSNETASFFLNSDKIKKVAPNISDDYIEYTISEPVIKQNDKLYVISDGIELGYNVKFGYDSSSNTIKIYTLPYLVTYYTPTITGYGYKEISQNFDNQKAILYNMFVVKNANDKYGVIDLKNNEIIGCKYDDMTFNESLQEFFVTNALKKVGIILANGENKINIEYDEIKLLDKQKGIYIVKSDNKYGTIDKNGNIKVDVRYDDLIPLDNNLGLYIVKYNKEYGVVDINAKQIVYCEYDSIGLDTKSFENIENKYLLFNNSIPVKKNNKWGLFDVKGNQILACEYDSFGCVSSTIIKDKIVNNVLIIPDSECIVVYKDKKYGIVNKNGEIYVQCLLNAVYSMTNSGVDTYYMTFNNNGMELEYEVLWYLEQMGLYSPRNNNEITKPEKEENTIIDQTNTTEDITEENVINNNVTNASTTSENVVNSNTVNNNINNNAVSSNNINFNSANNGNVVDSNATNEVIMTNVNNLIQNDIII